MKWFAAGDGDTPLDPDEAQGLRVDVSTRGQLDEVEQASITDALAWAYGRKRLGEELLTVSGLYQLHRRMFGAVWGWAGEPRQTDKTIGIAPFQIGPKLKEACDNAAYWFEEEVYGPEEAAARFHHKLVSIHPFPNGNGRHARLVADLLLLHRGGARLSWPGPTERDAYIEVLRAADAGRYGPLIELLVVRSESESDL